MSTKPILSIIIPVRNTPIDVLIRCIISIKKSIELSTYNVEIIIVDDNSDLNIFNRYNEVINIIDHNVRVLRSKVWLGIGAIRNIGANSSLSDYLTFVDSDDTVSIDCINELLKYRNMKTFVYSNNSKKSVNNYKVYNKLYLFILFKWTVANNKTNETPILYLNHICMPFLVPKKIFLLVGGYVEGVYSGEHINLFAKLITSNLLENYIYIDKLHYNYLPTDKGNHFGNISKHISGKENQFLENSKLFNLSYDDYRFYKYSDISFSLYLPSKNNKVLIPKWAIINSSSWSLNENHDAFKSFIPNKNKVYKFNIMLTKKSS